MGGRTRGLGSKPATGVDLSWVTAVGITGDQSRLEEARKLCGVDRGGDTDQSP